MANKNPTMENASENLSQILNPKESELQKSKRIAAEMSDFLGELQ